MGEVPLGPPVCLFLHGSILAIFAMCTATVIYRAGSFHCIIQLLSLDALSSKQSPPPLKCNFLTQSCHACRQFSISSRAFPSLCASAPDLTLVPCDPSQASQAFSTAHQVTYRPYLSNSTVMVTTPPASLTAFISWAFDQRCDTSSCDPGPVHYSSFPGASSAGGMCPAPASGNSDGNVQPRGCDIFVSFDMPNQVGTREGWTPPSLGHL